MRILITGRPATGKTLYSTYLADTRYNYPIYEVDNFSDFNVLTDKVKEIENCIVVIQHEKFFKEKLKFDLHLELYRNIEDLEKFYVKSPSGIEEHLFSDMGEYYWDFA